MLYLIESSGYKVGENNSISYFRLLKIGYTEDNSKSRRFLQYKLHNPTCQVLYEIPGATENHEKRVQYKFRDLLFSDYGREWFSYSEEIIDFFKNIRSLEELENLPKSTTNRDKYSKHKKRIKNVLSYLTNIMQGTKEFRELCEEIYDILGDKITDESYVMKYFESRFGKEKVEKYNKIQKSLRTGRFCEDDTINQEASQFLEEYRSLTEARKKMILLCESSINGRLSKEAIQMVLDQIPDSDYIKSYYQLLGPEKLKNLGYKRNNIERALGIVTFSWELLRDEIYSEFKEGDKLSLSSIKNRLEVLYSSINYKATPKAIDLEKWFELKKCKITIEVDGIKKRVDGYTFLKSKRDLLEEKLIE